MRLFSVFLCLAAGAFIVGLTPRPLLSPDWRAPYKAALASKDCPQIERIVDTLLITGLEIEGYRAVYDNHAAKRCKYAALSDYDVETAEVFGLIDKQHDASTYRRVDFRTSHLSRIYLFFTRTKYPVRSYIRRREQALFKSVMDNCRDKIRPAMSGIPNYGLLAFALDNPDVPASQINEIARNQRSACAKKIVADAAVIASIAKTDEEFATLVQPLFLASVLANDSPELGPAIEELEAIIPKRAIKIARLLEEEPPVYSTFVCDTWYGDRVLEGAIRCAVSADAAIGVEKNADVNALYYSRRAKRLGWRDINQIEAKATNRISPDCRDAIIELEAQETDGASAPRDFMRLKQPVYKEQVCDPTMDATLAAPQTP